MKCSWAEKKENKEREKGKERKKRKKKKKELSLNFFFSFLVLAGNVAKNKHNRRFMTKHCT